MKTKRVKLEMWDRIGLEKCDELVSEGVLMKKDDDYFVTVPDLPGISTMACPDGAILVIVDELAGATVGYAPDVLTLDFAKLVLNALQRRAKEILGWRDRASRDRFAAMLDEVEAAA